MAENPYQAVSTRALSPRSAIRRPSLAAYGILNAGLVALLLVPLAVVLAKTWMAPAFVPSEYNGDPVTYQHYFYIRPQSLLFLAIYFYVPNAILRFYRRRKRSSM